MHRGTRIHLSSRRSMVSAPPDDVWSVVANGEAGAHWYVDAVPLLFRDRLDLVVARVAGPVLGPAADRHPAPGRPLLETGDRVGFWQVTHAEGHRLDLVADVKAPGRVRLRTRVVAHAAGSEVTQEVRFDPAGLLGQLYMVTDLPAREAVLELVHRRLLAELRTSARQT